MSIDRDFLTGLIDDIGRENLPIILGAFRDDLARLTTALRAHAATGDLTEFHEAAHGLAGAAGAMGAAPLEAACRVAELCESTEMTTAASGIEALAAALLTDLKAFDGD